MLTSVSLVWERGYKDRRKESSHLTLLQGIPKERHYNIALSFLKMWQLQSTKRSKIFQLKRRNRKSKRTWLDNRDSFQLQQLSSSRFPHCEIISRTRCNLILKQTKFQARDYLGGLWTLTCNIHCLTWHSPRHPVPSQSLPPPSNISSSVSPRTSALDSNIPRRDMTRIPPGSILCQAALTPADRAVQFLRDLRGFFYSDAEGN
jgi:hypothetical protein